ncbi:MAG TPA: cupin domain-containing protein [Pilimelia sp.]|nr:cupin domain-containing protein [Pilimelia sp.]
MSRHLVRRAADARYVDVLPGFARRSMVDEDDCAVHTDFGECRLAPGAGVPARVQSFEESFYVLSGTVVLRTAEGAAALGPGDYGLLPIGLAHEWRNESDAPARWAQLRSPQPRARYGGDSISVPPLPRSQAAPVDVRDPRNRLYGHIEPAHMQVDKQSQSVLAVSASMRTALLVYSGITVKMMVDSDLGAQLTTMFMVQYDPDGVAGPHDHPFEETYLFLDGKAEATFDGQRYELGPGDVAFAGVGCVHGFSNLGAGPLRWLETQAPQPPARHSYRFVRDWDYLRSRHG